MSQTASVAFSLPSYFHIYRIKSYRGSCCNSV